MGIFYNINSTLNGLVEYSYANVTVNGSSFSVGGLVGSLYKATINRSYAKGNVNGSYNVGGLVGDNYNGVISETYATGNVTATRDDIVSFNVYAGGLVGNHYSSSSQAKIYNSYATGTVYGKTSSGVMQIM